jgi:hypothetical protein
LKTIDLNPKTLNNFEKHFSAACLQFDPNPWKAHFVFPSFPPKSAQASQALRPNTGPPEAFHPPQLTRAATALRHAAVSHPRRARVAEMTRCRLLFLSPTSNGCPVDSPSPFLLHETNDSIEIPPPPVTRRLPPRWFTVLAYKRCHSDHS